MQILHNKKASFDYHLLETFEAGICLQGWEVKALRQKRANWLTPRVVIQGQEAFLVGLECKPNEQVSTHTLVEPQRSKKLLLHKKQIQRLIGQVAVSGCTLIALNLYWKANTIKVSCALAKGKKLHDKRESIKKRDQQRQIQTLLKHNTQKPASNS